MTNEELMQLLYGTPFWGAKSSQINALGSSPPSLPDPANPLGQGLGMGLLGMSMMNDKDGYKGITASGVPAGYSMGDPSQIPQNVRLNGLVAQQPKQEYPSWMMSEIPKDFGIGDMRQLLVAVINENIVAAINTEIVIYPRKRAVRLINAGGSHLQQWGPELWEFMEQMAQNNNCDLIEAIGRPGWMRFLKSVAKDKGQTVKSTVVVSRKV